MQDHFLVLLFWGGGGGGGAGVDLGNCDSYVNFLFFQNAHNRTLDAWRASKNTRRVLKIQGKHLI